MNPEAKVQGYSPERARTFSYSGADMCVQAHVHSSFSCSRGCCLLKLLEGIQVTTHSLCDNESLQALVWAFTSIGTRSIGKPSNEPFPSFATFRHAYATSWQPKVLLTRGYAWCITSSCHPNFHSKPMRTAKSPSSTLLGDSPPEAFENAIVLLDNIRAIHSPHDGTIDGTCLHTVLMSLPIGRALAVNVRSQNATVLVIRQQDKLVFEVFELSPLDKAVIKIEGRLTRTFPGGAIAVPAKVLDEADFPIIIASTLSTICRQKVPGIQ